MLNKQKGITLIALIITIIVMLILVGVTVSVALNGGLFSKAEEATTKTKMTTVKEQLEIAKAMAIADNNGKALEDYSVITVEKLDGLDENIKNEFKDKIFVTDTGEVCYNPENVTDAEEKAWFEEVGINPNQGKKEEFYGVAYVAYSINDSSDSITVYLLDNGICVTSKYGASRYSKNGNKIEMLGEKYSLSEDYQTLELEDGSDEYQIFTRNENDRYEYSKNPVQHTTYKIYINAFYENEDGDIIITTDSEVVGEGTFEELISYGATVSEDGKTVTSPYGEIFTLIE